MKLLRNMGMAEVVELSSREYAELTTRLTLLPTKEDKGGPLEIYKLHPVRSHLWIPRHYPGIAHLSPMMEDKGQWPSANIRLKPEVELKAHQIPLVQSFFSAINGKSRFGGILKARTGAGKTVMGCAIMAGVKLPTLVVVPTDYLLGQWMERILEFTTIPRDRIGVVRQGRCDHGPLFDVTIAMIQSLTRGVREYPGAFYDWPGLVIFDEIHFLGARTFSRAAGMFDCKYRLGLSATPRRKDGMENVFLWHIGPVLAVSSHTEAKVRARVVEYAGADASSKGCWWNGKLSLGKYLNKLESSSERNLLLSNIVKNLYDKEKHVLLLSDRLGMLDMIRHNLIYMGVPADDIGMFTSKRKQTDRRILLGTYGSAGTGADIPRLNALVLATPRVDLEQNLGRVMRDKTPMVVDVVDTASKTMLGWYFARKKLYRKVGADIKGGR